jgi:hypothetical protein
VVVGDDKPHAVEAAPPERVQELEPERLLLDLAHVDPDEIAPSRPVYGVRDDKRLRADVPLVSDLSCLASSHR